MKHKEKKSPSVIYERAKNIFSIFNILTVIIFALGIFLRAKVFMTFHSLWLDECSLASSVINNKFVGELDFGQAAPCGFLLLTKLSILIFGISEFAFRILPFACSIGSVIGFYFLTKNYFQKKHSILIANVLFAVNYYLIYYSQEFKQYSSDVLITILLLIAFSKLDVKSLSVKNYFGLGVLFSLLFWFSFPSAIVSAGWIIYALFQNFKQPQKYLVLTLPVAVNLALYYFFHLSKALAYQSNFSFWQEGFINANFSNFLYITVENLNYFFFPCKFTLFALIFLVAGMLIFVEESRPKFWFLTSPVLLLITASYFHIYPIQQRVVLFLVPVLMLLILKPLDCLTKEKKIISSIVIFVCIAYFSGYMTVDYYNQIGGKEFYKKTDARGITKLLSNSIKSNEALVLTSSSVSPFEVYSKIYPIKYSKKIVGSMPYYDKKAYINALNSLPRGKYWFYIAHDVTSKPVKGFIEEWSAKKCRRIVNYKKGESYLIYCVR